MRYIYITALLDFQISGQLKSPIKIKEGLYITNNPAHTAGYRSPSTIVTLGTLEASLLSGSSAVIYKVDEQSKRDVVHTEVVNFLREVQAFLMAAWLVEDNSANCELAFAICLDREHVHSNSLAIHYCHHSGGKKCILVDHAKLEKICDLHRHNFVGVRKQDTPTHTSFRKTTGRLSRAVHFLQQARSADDLGQKIANYCSFFEASLSTTSSELSHQLSERVAFFLRSLPEERLDLFKEIKRAYNVRSKIVHGDTLSQGTIDCLIGICESCDEAARQVVLKIIADKSLKDIFDSSNDVLDSYMLNLIFGVSLKQGSVSGSSDA